MKKTYFRIIELPTHQVMLSKDFDSDNDDQPTLVITFFFDGIKVCQTLGYPSDEKRDVIFDSFTDEQAQSVLDTASGLFDNQD